MNISIEAILMKTQLQKIIQIVSSIQFAFETYNTGIIVIPRSKIGLFQRSRMSKVNQSSVVEDIVELLPNGHSHSNQRWTLCLSTTTALFFSSMTHSVPNSLFVRVHHAWLSHPLTCCERALYLIHQYPIRF